MAIHGVNNSSFNPYARSVGNTIPAQRPAGLGVTTPTTGATAVTDAADATSGSTHVLGSAQSKSVADAIKQDAAARTALISSPNAPTGVDQELWSVLTKEERGFFVKAGAMGPLTYGRFTPTQPTAQAPIVRGGRLDIKA